MEQSSATVASYVEFATLGLNSTHYVNVYRA